MKWSKCIAALGIMFVAGACSAAMVSKDLRCEYLPDPLGIGTAKPRLGWILVSPERGEKQTAYRILVASSRKLLDENVGDLWDSGKVISDDATHIVYAGKPLASRERCFWKVRTWDRKGAAGPWSSVAQWQEGLLQPTDWHAKWISGVPQPYLRKSFEVKAPIRRAMLYATALGLYDAYLNGHRVGDHVFAPGWTDYRKRVRYQAYDVTKLLKSGGNALGVLLGNGWFCGHIGNGGFQFYGKKPAFLAQLEITYTNGKTERIVTDGSWKSHPSPILSSDIMMGEDYDSRLAIPGWDQPGLDVSQWNPVQVRHESPRQLDAQVSQPVRVLCELKPKSISEPKPGHWVFDLGQNMVGVVRLRVSAPAGTRVTLRHGERLNPDGTIYTKNLRGARATDHYICDGHGVETWQPRFTYHGFRYVEVTGLPQKPDKSTVTGMVIGSATPRTGEFSCSNPKINQLQSNIQWGQRGNYFSVPTDCPQRNERLGWMGDAQVFVRTATYNANVAAFFTKWMVDVDDGQSPDGAFSDVSPNTMRGRGTPAWGDAGVICPWTIYQVYGDKRMLKRDLPAMIRWVQYLRQRTDGLIRDKDLGSNYGDWLSVHAGTPKDLIGTAYFAYSTHLVAKACAALGDHAEAAKYEKLFQDIKAAYDNRYVSADGRVKGNTQTAYAMTIMFNLLPDDLQARVAQHLKADIETRGWHLSTGFVGVSYLLPALAKTGHGETAYRLLLQDTYPSWLFEVDQGATTIWERWDGWTPDKGFENPGMNSFNHYAFGSCGEFLFADVGGIRPASPGYKTLLIKPVICKGLTWAKTSYDSIHGLIKTDWKKQGTHLVLDVTIPVNTTATVFIPANKGTRVTEEGKDITEASGVSVIRRTPHSVVVAVGSGNYKFACQ